VGTRTQSGAPASGAPVERGVSPSFRTPGGTISVGSFDCNDHLIVPFVFLVAVVATTAYVLRSRRPETATGTLGVPLPTGSRSGLAVRPEPVGIRGWLLLYMVGMAAELAHGLTLTIGSLVIYTKPSLAGLHSFIPLWALLIYVIGNLGLVAYGAVLLVLMSRGRKAAIAHTILFNALSIAFLVTWFLLGAKSPIGTVVDSLPGLAAITYFSRSRRVRNTFTNAATLVAGRGVPAP
jgi:hypothetical protein